MNSNMEEKTKIAVLDVTLRYLRFNLLWPKVNRDLNPGRSYVLKYVAMAVSTSILLIGSLLHFVVSIKNNFYLNQAEDLVVIIAEVGAYYFLSVFVKFQPQIAKIYIDLSDFKEFGQSPYFLPGKKRLDFLAKVYQISIDIAILQVTIFPIITYKECLKINELHNQSEVCGIFTAIWMPFRIDKFYLKVIFGVWQVYSLTLTLKGAAVISFAIMESMEHLILRIQHLKDLLKMSICCKDEELRLLIFKRCVKYHNCILSIGQRINRYYSACLFLHILLSGALFGCIGWQFMKGFSIKALLIGAGWLNSLFIVCFSGQRLLDESISISDVIYNNNWYETDVNFQRNVKFVMMRSRKPIVVFAGPFSYVSHILILSILKTAYSYMTLLNATTSS